MNILIGVIVGLLALMLLVVAHEFGHFLAARLNGVNVLEFGIGFPPRAIAWIKDPKTGKWRRLPRKDWQVGKLTRVVYSEPESKSHEHTHSKKRKFELAQPGMIFSINWLPIGGFCQMDGESDSEARKGTFGAASFWSKTKILFAGVAMNWLVAAIILTVLAWTGLPEFIPGQFTIPADSRVDWTPVQITEVLEGSPAQKANLEAGDYILSIDGVPMKTSGDIVDYDDAHSGQTIKFEVVRGLDATCAAAIDWQTADYACENQQGQVVTADVTLSPSDSDYLVGIRMESLESKTYSTWSAPLVGIGLTAQLTGETFKGVGEMIWNLISGAVSQFNPDATVREAGQAAISSVGDSVSGPVGIVGVLFPAFTAMGPTNLAFLVALISVSLACMNVLPIPALDGGRWLLIALFRLRHKKLTKEVEGKIVSRAFFVLLLLIIMVTVLDVVRIAQ